MKMFKKALILTVFGTILVSSSDTFAAIKSYSSYITIDGATSSDYTLSYNAHTTSNVKNFPKSELATEVKISRSGKAGYLNKITDFEESEDFVSYNPADWKTFSSEQENTIAESKQTRELRIGIEQYEAEVAKIVNSIVEDTSIDLSEYTKVSKTEIFKLDQDLFTEIYEITNNIEVGDAIPQIYLHDSKENVYVLKQNKDGESTAAKFVLDNGKWKKLTEVKKYLIERKISVR
ncbi:hypothetical protein [uncultured Brevibacillus sp.]|uniref:hypothetical protein n=1 Tax=uncultured Brevibacillus sp. TaxID=169970 RepID=UPI00259428E0|nr:hypothetical protein [uncultured Brevibacillus sp.]